MKNISLPFRWFLAAVATALLTYLTPASVVENIYSRGLFLGLRWVTSHTMSLLPFAWYYVFWATIIYLFFRQVRQLRRENGTARWRKFGLSVLTFVSVLYVCFQWLWGFHYGRIKFETQANLQADSIGTTELRQEIDTQQIRLTLAHQKLTEMGVSAATLPPHLEDTMHRLVAQTLREFGYPTVGKARVRGLKPKGILMRFSSSGVYWPFVAEANFDTGLHPLHWPYVMAHELSHAHGITDEGTCNFLAWLACQASEQPYIRYSGQICYWRELGANYKYADSTAYAIIRTTLPVGVVADLDAMNQNRLDYPDFVSLTGIYDHYLQWQGIPDGITNYSKIIRLVRAYRQKKQPPF